MKRFRLQSSPFVLLWLIAAGTTVLLALLKMLEADFNALQQHQADETVLAAILASVPRDNDLLNDTFQLDPAADLFAQVDLLGLASNHTGYIARQQDVISAIVLPAETLEGYNGSIRLLVGITPDGEVTGVRIVSHNETPRLGAKIELAFSDWVLNFNTRSLDNTGPQLWQVKKDGGEFDQFVGATITPRAVVAAVRKTLEFFTVNQQTLLKIEGTAVPQADTHTRLIASPGITALPGAIMQPLPLVIVALLLALQNSLAENRYPPASPPSEPAPGSKRVRVTGKS